MESPSKMILNWYCHKISMAWLDGDTSGVCVCECVCETKPWARRVYMEPRLLLLLLTLLLLLLLPCLLLGSFWPQQSCDRFTYALLHGISELQTPLQPWMRLLFFLETSGGDKPEWLLKPLERIDQVFTAGLAPIFKEVWRVILVRKGRLRCGGNSVSLFQWT